MKAPTPEQVITALTPAPVQDPRLASGFTVTVTPPAGPLQPLWHATVRAESLWLGGCGHTAAAALRSLAQVVSEQRL